MPMNNQSKLQRISLDSAILKQQLQQMDVITSSSNNNLKGATSNATGTSILNPSRILTAGSSSVTGPILAETTVSGSNEKRTSAVFIGPDSVSTTTVPTASVKNLNFGNNNSQSNKRGVNVGQQQQPSLVRVLPAKTIPLKSQTGPNRNIFVQGPNNKVVSLKFKPTSLVVAAAAKPAQLQPKSSYTPLISSNTGSATVATVASIKNKKNPVPSTCIQNSTSHPKANLNNTTIISSTTVPTLPSSSSSLTANSAESKTDVSGKIVITPIHSTSVPLKKSFERKPITVFNKVIKPIPSTQLGVTLSSNIIISKAIVTKQYEKKQPEGSMEKKLCPAIEGSTQQNTSSLLKVHHKSPQSAAVSIPVVSQFSAKNSAPFHPVLDNNEISTEMNKSQASVVPTIHDIENFVAIPNLVAVSGASSLHKVSVPNSVPSQSKVSAAPDSSTPVIEPYSFCGNRATKNSVVVNDDAIQQQVRESNSKGELTTKIEEKHNRKPLGSVDSKISTEMKKEKNKEEESVEVDAGDETEIKNDVEMIVNESIDKSTLIRLKKSKKKRQSLLKNNVVERLKRSPRKQKRSKSLTVDSICNKNRRLSSASDSQIKISLSNPSAEVAKEKILNLGIVEQTKQQQQQPHESISSSSLSLISSNQIENDDDDDDGKFTLLCNEKVEILPTDSSSTVKTTSNESLSSISKVSSNCDEIDDVPGKEQEDTNDVEEITNSTITTTNDWSSNGIGSTKDYKINFKLNSLGLIEIANTDDKNDINLKLGQKSNSIDQFGKLYNCEICNCHGIPSEFLTPNYCSLECIEKLQKITIRNREIEDKKKRSKLENNEESINEDDGINSKQHTRLKRKLTKNKSAATVTSMENLSYYKRKKLQSTVLLKMFTWNTYLKHCKSEPAAVKNFSNPLPTDKNEFEEGMKLEAIDPEHNSLFCVCTVIQKSGYRLKLHFDGYSNLYDFWINADSMDIFPINWCHKTNRKLQPPRGMNQLTFNWAKYLRKTKSIAAPYSLFKHLNTNYSDTNPFEIGMKLEADDLKNTRKVCVASVADVLNNRILIHFDGWDERYDYWIDITSPYIHPVHWHETNGFSIVPPPDWEDSFTWKEYLQETKCKPATDSMFLTRQPIPFKIGTKLEVVDKKNPSLVRPASILMTDEYEIKVLFDGWSTKYAFWLCDDSPDIHPVGWCYATGHDLESPPGYEGLPKKMPCPIPNCRGIGNVKKPAVEYHANSDSCPYELKNWRQTLDKSERLEERFLPIERKSRKRKYGGPSNNRPSRKMRKQERSISCSSSSQDKFIEDENTNEKRVPDDNDEVNVKNEDDDMNAESSTSTAVKVENEKVDDSDDVIIIGDTSKNDAINIPDEEEIKTNETDLAIKVSHKLLCDYGPRLEITHKLWKSNSECLLKNFNDEIEVNPLEWDCDDVCKFIEKIPHHNKNVIKKLVEFNIDGMALLSIRQNDLIDLFKLRIGPAVKIYNQIVQLRELVYTKFHKKIECKST